MPAQLTEPVLRFLEQPNIAVLATQNPSGGMQATPVWFLYADGQILINTARGRVKLRNMQARPTVALAIVDRQNPYRYVQIQGAVVAVDPTSGARDIDRLSQRYLGQPYAYPGNDRPENRVTILIEPKRVNAQGL
jgi:PPOX class probable F420-dependent enzyme